MIPSGLFTQLALFLLSIGIVFTYIEPAFQEISMAQEQIAAYQQELGKVATVNTTLQSKLQNIASVSNDDRDSLLTYMPDQVDPLVVMRDLQIIAAQAGVSLVDVSDGGPVGDDGTAAQAPDPALYGDSFSFGGAPVAAYAGPYPYAFSLSVEGTYTQIKTLISLLETNNYPLEIQNLNIDTGDGGFLNAQVDIYTYSQNKTDSAITNLYEDVNVIYE